MRSGRLVAALKIIIRTDVMYEKWRKCNDENGRRAYGYTNERKTKKRRALGKAIELLKQWESLRRICDLVKFRI